MALDGDLQTAQIFDHVGLGDVRASRALMRSGSSSMVRGSGMSLSTSMTPSMTSPAPSSSTSSQAPLHGGERQQRIDVLFKLTGGLRAHAEGKGRLADGGAVEVRGFEDDVDRVVHDLAVLAAHDAGQDRWASSRRR